MGKAVAADGSMQMQCQSCHGSMRDVGSTNRVGWLDQPNCQACHTGHATQNSGQIRYTSALDANGALRVPANPLFATPSNTPAPGLSLYRFSTGHGGLQCAACHGSTHAEYGSSHPSDNLQSIALQGHAGLIVECGTCHNPIPNTVNGGPHGMHPIGPAWVKSSTVNDHRDGADASLAGCQTCHGQDLRGTVLSRVQGWRRLSVPAYGSKTWWPGYQVGCYTCHDGPDSADAPANGAPTVTAVTVATVANTSTNIARIATDPNGDPLTLRIVNQPQHGAVALAGTTATYIPFADFVGNDTFTFAAWDGWLDSNLATGFVSVAEVPCVLEASTYVPESAPVNVPVPFWGAGALHGCESPLAWRWTFGDGSGAVTGAVAQHAYAVAGSYAWRAELTWGHLSAERTGRVDITQTMIDEDADALGDEWEEAHFGRLGATSGTADGDRDFFRDGEEYAAGTNPTKCLHLQRSPSKRQLPRAPGIARASRAVHRPSGLCRPSSRHSGLTLRGTTKPAKQQVSVSNAGEWSRRHRGE